MAAIEAAKQKPATDLADDRLVGVEAISEFRGEPLPRTRYLVRIGAIPVYREGRIICASKRVLLERHLQAAKGEAE
jgi:hypothetical protein